MTLTTMPEIAVVGFVKVLHVGEGMAAVTEDMRREEKGSEDKICMLSTLAKGYVKASWKLIKSMNSHIEQVWDAQSIQDCFLCL